MPPLIAFLILAIIGGFLLIGQTPETPEETLPQEEEIPQTQENSFTKNQVAAVVYQPALKSYSPKLTGNPVSHNPGEKEPTISLYTYIISGPEEGEVLDETNQVTFKFGAKISPKDTEGRLTFETKVAGFEEDWQETSAEERTTYLPPGPKEYTFLVRAKIKEVVDPTPASRTFTINTSPYFQKIKISSVRIQGSSYSSLITLSTRLNAGERINLTDWQIKGKRSSFKIPLGAEKYPPYYSVPTENIIVKPGDRIYLSGAANPLGRGRNFRPNKCLGYLTNYYDFPISFSQNCPRPTKEEISHLSACCQKFILDLRSCQAPDYSDNLSILRDADCTSYLSENFNYPSCFREYSRDQDFLEKSWHIYIGRDILMTEGCDTLYLQDQNGRLVDKYSYGQLICR